MNMEKIKKDFIASRNILKLNIKLYHEGHTDVYRVIASELRKLFCDGENSLASKLFSEIRLCQVRLKEIRENLPEDGIVFFMPASVRVSSDQTGKNKAKIIELFDTGSDLISLNEWLEQPLFNKKITIRELIKSIADKEGAHSDNHYGETLTISKSVFVGNENPHGIVIIAIGEYCLGVFEKAIENNCELKNLVM